MPRFEVQVLDDGRYGIVDTLTGKSRGHTQDFVLASMLADRYEQIACGNTALVTQEIAGIMTGRPLPERRREEAR